jgi:tRNA nucleotidyltransferase (CCA-adding enzyme)
MATLSKNMGSQLDPRVVPASLIDLLECLQVAGHEAFCVGGSVRDLIMGRQLHDWDVATSAEPHEVASLFSKVVKTGIAHGTVTVISDDTAYEVTTYRIDVGCSDGRRPDDVQFTRSLTEDLKRRDFTMNAMAWNPLNGMFVDPHEGCSDIAAKTIRAVGNPLDRLTEDGLRSLRGVRFAATLGFSLETNLMNALPLTLGVFEQVSVERIWQELKKLLVGGEAESALHILHDCGMWSTFWSPTLMEASAGLNALPSSLTLRLTHLFRHESKIFRSAAKKLKLPKKIIEQVAHLLTHYAETFDPNMSQLEAMRLRARLGTDVLTHVSQLAIGDERPGRHTLVQAFLARIEAPPFSGAPTSIRALPIDGRWIQSQFGIKPSPQIGLLLMHCLEGVWQQPELMTIEGCHGLITSHLEETS